VAKRNAEKRDAERVARAWAAKKRAYAKALKDWFSVSDDRKQAHMAKELGVSGFAVHSWVEGDRVPSGLYPDAIEIYTGGAVKAEACPRKAPQKMVLAHGVSK
jgi:hypothetical protein